MALPKELVRKGLVILKNNTRSFGAEPFYEVLMSTDEQFKVGDKVDIDNSHVVIRRLDDDSIVISSDFIYGRY